MYAEFVTDMTTSTLIRRHQNAFRYQALQTSEIHAMTYHYVHFVNRAFALEKYRSAIVFFRVIWYRIKYMFLYPFIRL